MTYCTGCGAALPSGAAFCSACGRAARPPSGWPAPAVPPFTSAGMSNRTMTGLAAVLLNALVFPGVGSLVGGAKEGWVQIGLAVGCILLFSGTMFVLPFSMERGMGLGVLGLMVLPLMLYLGVWIWAIVTGVRILREAQAPVGAL